MTTPKVAVFDLGKVLLHFDYSIAAKRVQPRCRVTVEQFRSLVDQSPLLLRYEANLMTTDEFFAEIQSTTGFCGDLMEFKELFADIFHPIEPMIALHSELRARGIRTYIFSNTNSIAIEHIRKTYPFFSNFDDYIYSYEHGAMKPDAKLYAVVERITGKKGGEILYIDDRPENIATGRERGWFAILHETPEATRAQIEKSGLLSGAAR